MRLWNRVDFLLAVDSPTGRRKHHLSYTMLDRLLQHIQRTKDIHLGIEDRIFHRFSHVHLCSKMHDNIGPLVAKYPFKPPTLDIELEETRSTIDISPLPSGQIVHNSNLMSFLDKTVDQM